MLRMTLQTLMSALLIMEYAAMIKFVLIILEVIHVTAKLVSNNYQMEVVEVWITECVRTY